MMFSRPGSSTPKRILPAVGTVAMFSAALSVWGSPAAAQAVTIRGFGSDAVVTSASPNDGTVYHEDNGTVTLNANSASVSDSRTLIPGVTSNVLQVTNYGSGFATSTWFDAKQNIAGPWTARFSIEIDGGPPADGFYFALQNNSAGLNYLGASGGGKGFTDSSGNAPASALGIGAEYWGGSYIQVAYGSVKDNDQRQTTTDTTNVDFTKNGGVADITISYDGNTALTFHALDTYTITNPDKTTTTITDTYDHMFTLQQALSQIVGGSSAYIGFTGGTGGASAIQKISNFQFSTVPEPASLALLALGAVGLLIGRRRKPAA